MLNSVKKKSIATSPQINGFQIHSLELDQLTNFYLLKIQWNHLI